MRILLLTRMWPSAQRPQYGAFVEAQYRSLLDLGVEVKLMTLNPRLPATLSYGFGIARLWRTVSHERCDLVHAHYGYCIALACMQHSVPVVGTYHGSDVYRPGQLRISRWAGARAQCVIVTNKEMRRILGRGDAIVLPCGVNVRDFVPRDKRHCRRRVGLTEDAYYVIFPYDPSRIDKRYGLAQATVDAINKHGHLDKHVRLVVAFREERDRYIDFLNASDALLLTSAQEGSPTTVKEALACRVPVVSVCVGDAAEVLRGLPGCAVVSTDVAALAHALCGAIVEGGNDQLVARAHELSVERVGAELVRCYERVLSNGGPRRKAIACG